MAPGRPARPFDATFWLLSSAAAVATLAAVTTVLWPRLDVAVAGWFYDGSQFFWRNAFVVVSIRSVFYNLYVGACLLGVAGLILTQISRTAWLGLKASKWLFLVLCLVTGPGIVANMTFKDNWGRARPSQITEFGGQKTYTPALIPANQCNRNCSFISGEASSMFAVFFAAAFLWRRRCRQLLAAGVAAGLLAGLMRMMQGAHFLTDVLFAGVFMALTTAAVHLLIETIEAASRSDELQPFGEGGAWQHT